MTLTVLFLSLSSALSSAWAGAPGACAETRLDLRAPDARTVLSYSYDEDGRVQERLARFADGGSLATAYFYGDDGRLEGEEDSDGAWAEYVRRSGVTFAFTSGSRRLGGGYLSRVQHYGPDGVERVEVDLDGDDLIDRLVVFDYAGGLLSERSTWAGDQVVRQVLYDYDAAGRLLTTQVWDRRAGTETWRHRYDGQGRLVEKASGTRRVLYDYSCGSK